MVNSANYYEKETDRLRKISAHLAHFLGIQWEGEFATKVQRRVPDGRNKVACPLSESGGRSVLSPASLLFELENEGWSHRSCGCARLFPSLHVF